MHKPTGHRSLIACLAVLALLVAGAATALLVGPVRSGGPNASERSRPAPLPAPPPEAEPVPGEGIQQRVVAVNPALKATIPGGVSQDMVNRARSVPGVGAAAKVLLSNLTVEVPGVDGESQVSVAAIDPEEFRPLAPEASAQAPFVWEGLSRSETFIAHEQFQIFGGKPLTKLAAQSPSGRKTLRIAGLAANGVPNLAGAMMSFDKAADLGLTNPTLLVVGLNENAQHSEVVAELGRALPGIRFEQTRPVENRSFFSGLAAQKAIGSFRYQGNEDGSISQDTSWVARNIVGKTMPILGHMRCHKAMFPQLEAALTEIQDRGLAGLINPGEFGGCHVPRFIGHDSGKGISMHAWGLALDINVPSNLQGEPPQLDPRIVAVFESWGFRWGGRWSVPDGMHFELAALIKQ
ncbi:MAG: M15 family metallopeptidase [Actinomycetota bacterium]